jgi:hypothetical protein
VNKIYGIFGHGVNSGFMTWMFLYPLVGGAFFYFLITIIMQNLKHSPGYRLFFNLYNSGLTLLTVGSFLKGIFEIAGTDSPYIICYFGGGVLLIAIGIVSLFATMIQKKTE